jgi:hypothetical protein
MNTLPTPAQPASTEKVERRESKDEGQQYSPNLTEADIDRAAKILAKSERGRAAMQRTVEMLDAGGIGLDADSIAALMTLLYASFTDWPGYAREAMHAGGEQ